MSRSGYDCDGGEWAMICWCGALAPASKEMSFKELEEALDSMLAKRLITDDLEVDGDFCTLGALGKTTKE